MKKEILRKKLAEERDLEGSFEWIVAREVAPLQAELARMRAYFEALREATGPW